VPHGRLARRGGCCLLPRRIVCGIAAVVAALLVPLALGGRARDNMVTEEPLARDA
jgi:hypothetical protein